LSSTETFHAQEFAEGDWKEMDSGFEQDEGVVWEGPQVILEAQFCSDVNVGLCSGKNDLGRLSSLKAVCLPRP
jgi:hypothetical protein